MSSMNRDQNPYTDKCRRKSIELKKNKLEKDLQNYQQQRSDD